VQARSIVFHWVKGHSGNRWNDEADRLATEAADRQDVIEEQSLF
ncbi:MAG: ribonuclease HI, partial [Acidimicrobiia bacterium]|nr:ribonuclease HI [Acidimicrobiia bacterium]